MQSSCWLAWYGVRLTIERSRVRSPAWRRCVTTPKLFTPICLDTDSLGPYGVTDPRTFSPFTGATDRLMESCLTDGPSGRRGRAAARRRRPSVPRLTGTKDPRRVAEYQQVDDGVWHLRLPAYFHCVCPAVVPQESYHSLL